MSHFFRVALFNVSLFNDTPFSCFTRHEKLNKKHIIIQMTQPSFKTYACNECCTIDLYSKMY